MRKKKNEIELDADAFETIASTDSGLRVLRRLYRESNYGNPRIMTFNPATSEMNQLATIYNLSKRDVWAQLRQLLSPAKRALIENQEIENNARRNSSDHSPSDDGDDSPSGSG